MARNLKPTLPQPPRGFEDRVISTQPRPAADDGHAYEARIYQANAKYEGQIPSNLKGSELKDRNLYSRVSKVRDVSATPSHIVVSFIGLVSYSLTLYRNPASDIINGAGAPAAHMYTWMTSDSGSLVYYYTTTLDIETGTKVGTGTSLYSYESSALIPWKDIVHGLESGFINSFFDHSIDKYPGESNYFIKECLTSGMGYLTLTITPGEYLRAAAHKSDQGKYNDSLEYCNNGVSWKPLLVGVNIQADSENKIYLRGRIEKYGGLCPCLGGNPAAITSIEGDITALINYRNLGVPPMSSYLFEGLLEGCTALTDASGLTFPTAYYKHSYVFKSMFKGCTALTTVPDLSEYPLHDGIYMSMFEGCTALATAPTLPEVNVLPADAYFRMFYGCTHLSSIKVHIGTRIEGDGLRDWMYNAGTAVNGQCTFYHSGDFRWRYPSKSGIPGAAADNQKEWTPIPALTTKLYFSTYGVGGSVQAVYPGATPRAIYSGESVVLGSAVTITAVPAEGYEFDSWAKNTTGTAAVGNTITINSFPYGRWEDGEDKKEAIATFKKVRNLYVHYNEGTGGSAYTSDIAFVRNTAADTTRPAESGDIPMYAWSCVYLGDIFTESATPTAGYNIWTTDQSETNWHKSEDSYIRNEIYTDSITVLVFDDTPGSPLNIEVVAGGSTFRNFNRSYCACIAPVNSEVTVTVTLTQGEALNWIDGETYNPRTIIPTLENKGVMIRRAAPAAVNFSCTNGSVAATVDGMGIQSGTTVAYGKSVIFTITPDEGYEYTGTNPETVVVTGAITKAYECVPATPAYDYENTNITMDEDDMQDITNTPGATALFDPLPAEGKTILVNVSGTNGAGESFAYNGEMAFDSADVSYWGTGEYEYLYIHQLDNSIIIGFD